jgi:polyhydroxyalkanoate synthase subunit PhaE
MTPEEQQRATSEAASGALADWVEHAQAMTRAWMTAQPTAAAGGSLVGDWMQQWQALARSSLRGWPAESEDVSGEVATRLLTGEQAFLNVAEVALGMMRAVAPKIDVGDEWVELLRQFLGQMREDMLRGQSAWTSPEGVAATTGDVTELWRLYSLELQRFFGPWGSAYQDAAVNFAEAGRGDPTAMHKTFAGFVDAYEVTFGRFLSASAVGSTRESTEPLLKGFDAWVEMNRAAVDFQTELANTDMHAVEALMRRLVDMGEKGEHITTVRGFFDLWVDNHEKAYNELFGSDSFATIQGRFVNASLIYRRRQAEMLDELMDTVGLPSRKEVDQIHRHVHDLRIELRWMKRDMRALRRELEATAASAGDPPAEKPSAEPAPSAAGAAEASAEPAEAATPGAKPAKAAKAGAKSRRKAAPATTRRQRRPPASDSETPRP